MFSSIRFLAKWCAITALCVLFSELSVRAFGIWPQYQLTGKGIAGGKGVNFFTLDTETLFRMIPNEVHHINADGFRDTKPTVSGDRLITVSGDSFPMGLVVEPEETFPNQLEKLLPGREVYNMGIQGFGPDQALIMFKRYAVPLKPSHTILSLYPSNDFNDLVKNRLFDADPSSGKLKTIHPNPIEEVVPLFRLPAMLRLVASGHFLPAETEAQLSDILFNDKEADDFDDGNEDQKSQALMRLIIREFKAVAMANSITLSAVVVPSYRELDRVRSGMTRSGRDTTALAICHDEGVPVVDLYPAFQRWTGNPLYSVSDKHLSAAGHAEAARIISEVLPLSK